MAKSETLIYLYYGENNCFFSVLREEKAGRKVGWLESKFAMLLSTDAMDDREVLVCSGYLPLTNRPFCFFQKQTELNYKKKEQQEDGQVAKARGRHCERPDSGAFLRWVTKRGNKSEPSLLSPHTNCPVCYVCCASHW